MRGVFWLEEKTANVLVWRVNLVSRKGRFWRQKIVTNCGTCALYYWLALIVFIFTLLFFWDRRCGSTLPRFELLSPWLRVGPSFRPQCNCFGLAPSMHSSPLHIGKIVMTQKSWDKSEQIKLMIKHQYRSKDPKSLTREKGRKKGLEHWHFHALSNTSIKVCIKKMHGIKSSSLQDLILIQELFHARKF